MSGKKWRPPPNCASTRACALFNYARARCCSPSTAAVAAATATVAWRRRRRRRRHTRKRANELSCSLPRDDGVVAHRTRRRAPKAASENEAALGRGERKQSRDARRAPTDATLEQKAAAKQINTRPKNQNYGRGKRALDLKSAQRKKTNAKSRRLWH